MSILLMWSEKMKIDKEESGYSGSSDKLTTSMFIVASYLSEAQSERLTSSPSLLGVNVPAYTLEAVKTVFVELFCTPKSSMENFSLRVNRHGGSTNRTFIVESYTEDEFGQWATDEVTGEQNYINNEGYFLTWNTTSILCSPDLSRAAK